MNITGFRNQERVTHGGRDAFQVKPSAKKAVMGGNARLKTAGHSSESSLKKELAGSTNLNIGSLKVPYISDILYRLPLKSPS